MSITRVRDDLNCHHRLIQAHQDVQIAIEKTDDEKEAAKIVDATIAHQPKKMVKPAIVNQAPASLAIEN